MSSTSIFVFIFIVTLVINTIIYFIGEENLSHLILNVPVLGPMVAGIVGLIPNCAGSVILTQLFLEGVITFGSMMGGLLVGSGIGILILYRTNKNIKENISKFLIIGLSAYIIIVYCFMPQYAESFKTILNLSDADFTIAGDSIVYQIGTIGRIIKTLFSMSFQIIRILLPAYIIRSVCKKNASPKLAFAVLIVFCLLQFFFLTSTFAEAIVACLAIILYYLHLFPSKKKKIIMLIGISTIGIMIVYFAVRYFSKNSSIYDKSSGPILYMAQIISAYFTGPDNVAAIFNVDKSFGKEAFKAGIIGAIPFNSTLFGDRGNKLQYYYNIYNRAYGQIPPTIGAGYYYFGFILAPIISILFVKLSLVYYDKAQKINKSIKYISEIFCSITFALGTVMYSPSITLAWFFSWGIPMLILTSFTGEK